MHSPCSINNQLPLYLHREQAKGATFFITVDGEAARPMVDIAWAPMLGAFSVNFEQFDDQDVVELCLAGFRVCCVYGVGGDFGVGIVGGVCGGGGCVWWGLYVWWGLCVGLCA